MNSGAGPLRRAAAVLVPALLLVAAVFFWRLGRNGADALLGQSDLVSFRGLEALTAASYLPMAEQEAAAATFLPFALWTQLENKRIAAAVGGRNESVAVVAVRGDSRLVLPAAAAVAMDDGTGCLLDRQTAEMLFGKGDSAAGGAVVYEETTYYVRGVVDMPAPTMLIQLPEDSALPLDNIAVSGRDAAGDFPARHSLVPALAVRYETFYRLASLLGGLPLAVAAVLLAAFLVGQLWRQREYPLRSAVLFLALCALVTALLLVLLTILPPEYVPTRWSDFSFWSDMLAERRAETVALFAAAKLRPELLLLSRVGQSAAGLLSAALLPVIPSASRRLRRPIPQQ